MKTPKLRRLMLVLLLAGSLLAWLGALGFQWSCNELENYPLLEQVVWRRPAPPPRRKRAWENYTLIEPGLYVGGDESRPPPDAEAVLNLCERDDPYRTEVYLWETIPDRAPAPSLEWLRKTVDFVAENRSAGRTTFVHCQAGVSRCGLVTTAYLMQEHGLNRDDALDLIRKERPQVRPNPAFMELLSQWERELELTGAKRRGGPSGGPKNPAPPP